MQAILIGFSSGFLTIFVISCLRNMDKQILYALILAGIGFLYVGYTWSDINTWIFTSVQAICFLFLSYFGVKNGKLLALGYFLHGIFDVLYGILPFPDLLPPHYNLFCISIDFTIGIYLAILHCRRKKLAI